MRIGIDLTYLLPGRIGGVENYLRNLVRCLQSSGGGHQYILFGNPLALESLSVPADGWSREPVGPKPFGWSGLAYRVLRRLLLECCGHDVIGDKPGRWALDLLHQPINMHTLRTSTPVVLTVHDIQHEYFPEFFSRDDLSVRRRWYARSIREARQVIAISNHTRHCILEKYSIPPDRVKTIHFGVDPQFRPEIEPAVREAVRQKYRLPDRFLVYPANSWPHKNHAVLFQALRWLKDRHRLDFKTVLVGVVYRADAGLMQKAVALGLGEDLVHPGPVRHEEMPAVYALARGMAFPSLFEGFGMPVIEAMACGCPVVCSTSASLPEVAGDAALLVPPTETEAWALALERLVQEEELRSMLRLKGLNRAAEFSWSKMAQQTREVYEMTVG